MRIIPLTSWCRTLKLTSKKVSIRGGRIAVTAHCSCLCRARFSLFVISKSHPKRDANDQDDGFLPGSVLQKSEMPQLGRPAVLPPLLALLHGPQKPNPMKENLAQPCPCSCHYPCHAAPPALAGTVKPHTGLNCVC